MIKGELRDNMNAKEFQEYLAKKKAGQESRFGAVPTQTADGQKFKSVLESKYYKRCWVLLQAGEITLIEREVRYEITINGVFITAYMMDFRITYADGHIEHIDCKSTPTMTPLYRVKKQLMLAVHGIDLKEIYEHDFK